MLFSIPLNNQQSSVLNINAQTHPQTAILNINGIQTELPYIEQNNKRYYSLKPIASKLGINVSWLSKENTIKLTYPDKSEAKILVESKQLLKEGLYTPIDFLINQNTTYIEETELRELIRRKYFWDSKENTLYLYLYAYPKQGDSLITEPLNQGLRINNNFIEFEQEGLVQASWRMNGELVDFRLISKSIDTKVKEYEYAAFYQTDANKLSQLILTQRILPNDDRLIFIRAYSSDNSQYISHNILQSDNIYASNGVLYNDLDKFHTVISKPKYTNIAKHTLKSDQSIDTWYLFSKESLTIEDPYVQRAWDVSKQYHQSNAWMTPEGTYRGTAAGYQEKINYPNNNISLQASAPLLLMETLEIADCRLLEDVVHSASYTLLKNQGEDGFWHSDVSVNYLNKAYQLGAGYIDTRMSVDASLFLLKFGLKYNDKLAIDKAKAFKEYFNLLKSKGLVYRNGEGVNYPDYYSNNLSIKTVASLNHALYEMNYLYTLYNLTSDEEARILADEILAYINNSSDSWITPKGDLYYAISPIDKYFGEDYINITYMDLFVAKSILNYMGIESQGIDKLYQKKGEYLEQDNTSDLESHLNFQDIYKKFDQGLAKKGDIFLSYPIIEITRAEGNDFAYFSYGTYYFFKGVESVSYNGEVKTFDPTKKYMIEVTKEGIEVTAN